MAIQIKVANEAKQDITISKADQILGKLADQTIIAKTVKSIQTGTIYTNQYASSVEDLLTSDGRLKLASISPVDINKCECDVLESWGYQGNSYTAAAYSPPPIATKTTYDLEFKSDGIYTEIIRGTDGFVKGDKNSNHILQTRGFKWRIVEYY